MNGSSSGPSSRRCAGYMFDMDLCGACVCVILCFVFIDT